MMSYLEKLKNEFKNDDFRKVFLLLYVKKWKS